jgi:hypothetical protein
MEPILTFVDEPVYMREITKTLSSCRIEPPAEPTAEPDYEYCVMSIDIGIIHLGISVTTLDNEYNIIEIIWIDLIDITEFTHKWGPSRKNCTLHHTKTFCDWLNHIFQENLDFFEKSDYILIERQPPSGLVAIEQLIFSRWRDKAILVHPRSMHKYFNIGEYDYEQRKIYTEKIARMHLEDPALQEQLGFYGRAHDIADSICLMLFWIKTQQDKYNEKKRREHIMKRQIQSHTNRKNMTTEEWFELHRYIPRDSKV